MRMRLLLVVVVVLGTSVVLAADRNKPHPHKGVLKPYTEPAPLKLSTEETAQLAGGKAVMRQVEGENGGRGLAVFKVNAPPQTVWNVICDFPQYPKWIKNVKKTEVYRQEGENIDVAFTLAGLGFSIDYFIHHVYRHEKLWGTWTLDYSRQSDLDDSVGFWRVTPWPGNPEQSQVEYSVDVQVRGWIPGFVRGIIVDNGLKQATGWVKEQAEARHKAPPR
ncbi:MAG: SRPBCC family protein [Myxococcota bacterium]